MYFSPIRGGWNVIAECDSNTRSKRDPLTEEDLLTTLDNDQQIGWPMKEYLVPPNAILVPNLLEFEQCTDLSSHFLVPLASDSITKIKELQNLTLKIPQRRWVSWKSNVKKCSLLKESLQRIERKQRELSLVDLEGGEKEVIDFTTEALFLKKERNGKQDGMFAGMVVMFGVNHLQDNSIQLSSTKKPTPYYPIIWDCAEVNKGISDLKPVVERIIYRKVNQFENDFDVDTINNQMDKFLKKYYFPKVDPQIQRAFTDCVFFQKASRKILKVVNLNTQQTNLAAFQAYQIALDKKGAAKSSLVLSKLDAKKAYTSFFDHIASLSWNVQLDLEIEVAQILLFQTEPYKHAEKIVKDCVPLNCPDKYPLNLECSMGMEVQFTITNSVNDQKNEVLTLYLHHLQRFCVFPEYCVPTNLYEVDLDRVLQPRFSSLNPEDLQNNEKENDSYTRIMINLLENFRKASNADALLLHDVLKIDNYHVSLYNASQFKLGFYTSYINGLKLVKNYNEINDETIEEARKAGIPTIKNALGTVTRSIECYKDEEVKNFNDKIFNQLTKNLKKVFESKEYPLVKYFKNTEIRLAWKFSDTLSKFLKAAKDLNWTKPIYKDVTGDLTFDGLLYALLRDLDFQKTTSKEERQYLNDLDYGRYYMYNPVVPQPSGLWIREVPTSYLQFKNLMQVFKPERPQSFRNIQQSFRNIQPLLFVEYPWTKESKAYAKSRKRLQWLQIRSRSRSIKRSRSRSIKRSRSRSKSKSKSKSKSPILKPKKTTISLRMMKPLLLQMKLKRSRSRSPPQNQNCISLQTFLSKCFQMLDEKNTGTRVGLKTEIYYVSITINTLSGTQSLESRATCRRGPNNFIDDGYMYDPLECLSTQGSLPFPRLGQVNVDYDKDVKEFKIYVYYPRSDEKTIPRYDRTIFTGDGFDYFKFVPSLRTRNKIISQNFYPFSTDKNAFKLFTKSQESKLTAADKNKLSTFTVDPAYEGYSYYCVEGGVHTLYLLWHLDEEWKISVK